MTVAFCLTVGSNEPPCSTIFSHLYVEHAGGRGILGFLSKDDADSLAATCQEAEQEVSKFRWSNFLRKVKQIANKKETKEDYWISKINSSYNHIPIIDIHYVKEICEDDRFYNNDSKEYMVKLTAENWINPQELPILIFVNLIVYDDAEMEAREDFKVCRMDTYNFRRDAKIKDVLIDNPPNHVISFEEHRRNEERKNHPSWCYGFFTSLPPSLATVLRRSRRT